jgi:hypothetical protein
MTSEISTSIYVPVSIFTLAVISLMATASGDNKVRVRSESVLVPNSAVSNSSELEVSYDEEYQLFEKDYPKRRRKRFIYYNVDSNFDVGYLVVIPITVVVPGMSNLFNKWRRRRSIGFEDSETNLEFEDHPTLEPHLDRISTYFDLLNVSNDYTIVTFEIRLLKLSLSL